jgi:hypothetical protein
MRRLTHLVDNFDREWETHWATKARDTTYLATIFPFALELLDYRCPKGHRGHCETACDVCDRSPSIVDSGEDNDAAHKRAVDIWHRSYTTWAADARKRGISDTSHKAYEKESPKRPARLDRRALASQQHRIAPIATFCDLVD